MIYSPNKTLYGNFKMHEVAKSSIADRLGINNTPSDEVLERAEQVAIHIVQPVRDYFGIPFSPESWFRCEALEKAICAHDFDNLGNIGYQSSFFKWMQKRNYKIEDKYDAWQVYFSRKSHPKGESVDFEITGINNRVLYNWCKDNLPEYDQLIAEFMNADDASAGWVHGSYSIDNNRKQLIEIK